MCGAEIDTWYGYSHNEEMVKKKKEKERLTAIKHAQGQVAARENIASKYILNKRYAHYSVTTCDTSKVDTVQITGIR